MYASSINDRYIDELVDTLRRGGVVIYPTDTTYAIGCNALSNRAVERVCKLRGINPAKQRLTMVCADISQASDYARINNQSFRLLRENIPGPFTSILPASPRLAKAFKGRHEVGVRIPDNEIARRLAQELGNPLLSATANWDGAEPDELCHVEEVKIRMESLQPEAFIDAGDAPGGETTIINLSDSDKPEIIREGKLSLSGL